MNIIHWLFRIAVLITACSILRSCQDVPAWSYTTDQWANAIRKAENSPKHPYGIMVKYRHTSPRQACINTVLHQYRNWCAVGHPGAFLAYLSNHYAPIRANNDPTDLNRNWQHNVEFFLCHPKA